MATAFDHNRPRHADEAVAAVKDALRPFEPRIEQFKTAFAKVVIRDRHDAASAVDLVGMAQDVGSQIEEQRKAISAPYAEAQTAAIATARNAWEPIESEIGRVTEMVTEFKTRQKALADQQQAEQEAEMARLRAARQPQQPRQEIVYADGGPAPAPSAPAAAPRREEIRGDYGYRLKGRANITVTITDITQVPLEILTSRSVTEAIEKVARALAKERDSIPGIAIDRGQSHSVS